MDDLLEVRQSELKRHVESTLNLKRVPSLKRMCRSRGMRVGGRKADLVDRLVVDVLDKGWSIATDTDLWRDYSMVPDSPADSGKRSKAASNDQASISNLDDSDSGRSSPPSSSASNSPCSSSTNLSSIPDDSSVGSVSVSEAASRVDPTSRDIYAFDEHFCDATGEGSPALSRKRVPLFVDTESPDAKRKKNPSGQSDDSGIHAPARRPHMTRRALKANLKKTRTSSRRSGTDFLSRSNIGVVYNTIKEYAIREAHSTSGGTVATEGSSRSRQGSKGKQSKVSKSKNTSPRIGVSDVVPISIISCDSLRNGAKPATRRIVTAPSPPLRSALARDALTDPDNDDGNESSSSSTTVVATLTSPTGVPVAIVTTQPSSPASYSDSGDDTVATVSRRILRSVSSSPVTPVIEWIQLADGPVATNP